MFFQIAFWFMVAFFCIMYILNFIINKGSELLMGILLDYRLKKNRKNV